jgi:hypothetical protein
LAPVAEATAPGSIGFASAFAASCAAGTLAEFGGGAAWAVDEQPVTDPPSQVMTPVNTAAFAILENTSDGSM